MLQRSEQAFAEAIGALHAMLGVEDGGDEPVVAPWQIAIDDFTVTFEHSDDERCLKTSLAVGVLSADAAHRHGQLRRILKRNFGLLRDQRFVAVISETDDRRLVLQLQFAEPYAELRPQVLAGRLGELVTIAELYGEILGGEARREKPATVSIEESIIFRP